MRECVVRPEDPADHPAIRDVVSRAFDSTAEADLVEAIRAAPECIPELALVAELDGTVVGHVMVSLTYLDDGTTRHEIHQLSPLAVAPDHQRSGVGSALVRSVLERSRNAGAEFVILEGDPRYYSRFGFEPCAAYDIHIDLPDWAPPEAAQICLLSKERPSVRGHVVYPESFDTVTQHR